MKFVKSFRQSTSLYDVGQGKFSLEMFLSSVDLLLVALADLDPPLIELHA
jgi:hypothetical protein